LLGGLVGGAAIKVAMACTRHAKVLQSIILLARYTGQSVAIGIQIISTFGHCGGSPFAFLKRTSG
jgi:hypothetical protein